MAGNVTLDGILERLTSPLGTIVSLSDAYKKLQVVVGVLAISLCPIVVAADHLFGMPPDDVLRGSVSAYYYGRGGNWFVGALFAIAVFFLSYEYSPRGADRRVDNLQSTFASVCAVVVALAPTSSDRDNATGSELVVHYVHGIAAALLFISLAVFSLFHFTKSDAEDTTNMSRVDHLKRFVRTNWTTGKEVSGRKKLRNVIYRACGWVIVVALLVLAATFDDESGSLFFWAEVLAITAFGISWLVKGEAIGFLNDPPGKLQTPKQPPIELRDEGPYPDADRPQEAPISR